MIMAGRVRSIIGEKLSQYIKQNNVCYRLEVQPNKKESANEVFGATLQLPLDASEASELQKVIPDLKLNSELMQAVRFLPAIGKQPAYCEFQLQPQAFLEDVLLHSNQRAELPEQAQSHIVLEFSSPNIAKPFHVGHLRSTIIGNVISNLHRHLGYRVTNLNYLGDWGTQFGLLQIGVEMTALTDEQMRQQPIQSLYRAYVTANEAAKTDTNIVDKARQYFTQLENGASPEIAKQWQKYREYTVAELSQVYARLGVHFDHYEWESQYSQSKIVDVLQQLSEKSLLTDDAQGRRVVHVDGRSVPIIKSDGSTLYLARDIAALLDRLQRFNFERIIYVVDNSQTDHFKALFHTTSALCEQLPLTRTFHVKFGRIRGMSTRSGNAVFLRDVLDEARDIMLEKQSQSPTTKVELSTTVDSSEVADILGVSAVLINDLKQRRQRDYDFDWNKALQMNGDTGIKMQYTHCRLSSLLEKMTDVSLEDVHTNFEHLREPEMLELLLVIARFEQAVWQAKDQLEACILVNYLFTLCNTTSRALKRVNVKNEPILVKQQNRLLLFKTAKETLSKGMQILGLRPLTKM